MLWSMRAPLKMDFLWWFLKLQQQPRITGENQLSFPQRQTQHAVPPGRASARSRAAPSTPAGLSFRMRAPLAGPSFSIGVVVAARKLRLVIIESSFPLRARPDGEMMPRRPPVRRKT